LNIGVTQEKPGRRDWNPHLVARDPAFVGLHQAKDLRGEQRALVELRAPAARGKSPDAPVDR
jgi:hypothetical protein